MMYLMYQEAFENSNTGLASAIGVLMFVISLGLVMLRFATTRKEKRGTINAK
jgi:ABC-type sugar transport system permease subunit